MTTRETALSGLAELIDFVSQELCRELVALCKVTMPELSTLASLAEKLGYQVDVTPSTEIDAAADRLTWRPIAEVLVVDSLKAWAFRARDGERRWSRQELEAIDIVGSHEVRLLHATGLSKGFLIHSIQLCRDTIFGARTLSDALVLDIDGQPFSFHRVGTELRVAPLAPVGA